MKNLTKIIPIIVLSIFIYSGTINAQEVKIIPVAEVNIYDAASKKINNNTYSISFRLQNNSGIQPNIRYGIYLVKKNSSEAIDMKLINEAITLGEDEYKDITIKYSIPKFIEKGVYNIYIVAKNQNGFLLGYVPAGFPQTDITINKTSANVKIDSCYLTVESKSSTSTKRYTDTQGVDIKPEESLIANCKISNSGEELNALKLQLITHKRDQFGDIVANNIIDQNISIKNATIQDIKFIIPTITNPQSYNIDTFIVNNDEEKLSPSHFIHYVMTGASATLQNTILNKESYKVGDIAELQAFWSPSADTFQMSRYGGTKTDYILIGKIYDKDNNICGAIEKNLENNSSFTKETLKVNILKDCEKAIAKIILKDKENKVLDEENIDKNNASKEIGISIDTGPKGFNKIYALVFVLVLVLIGYGILVLKKSRENEINKSK